MNQIEAYLFSKELSMAEVKVGIQLMMSDKSIQEIASSLFIAARTVKFHTTSIYKKVGVKRRTQFMVHMAQVLWNIQPTLWKAEHLE